MSRGDSKQAILGRRTSLTRQGRNRAGLGIQAFVVVLAFIAFARAEVIEVPLKNPSFSQGIDGRGVPAGWSLYAGGGVNQRLQVTPQGLLLEDGDPNAELGLTQNVPVEPSKNYEIRVSVRAVQGASCAGAHAQLRFLPSHQLLQTDLDAENSSAFNEVSVAGIAPPGTKSAQIYLYTHRDPTPTVLIKNVRLLSGIDVAASPPEPLPPA